MIRFADRTREVANATLELFHLYSRQPGWYLDAVLSPGGDRFAVEGRVFEPPLPGPSTLVISYVDAPRVVTIDDHRGTLGMGEPAQLACTALGAGRVHLAGSLALRWTPLGGGDSRSYAIEVDLDAALIT